MIDYRLVTALPDKLEQHHLITYPESPLLQQGALRDNPLITEMAARAAQGTLADTCFACGPFSRITLVPHSAWRDSLTDTLLGYLRPLFAAPVCREVLLDCSQIDDTVLVKTLRFLFNQQHRLTDLGLKSATQRDVRLSHVDAYCPESEVGRLTPLFQQQQAIANGMITRLMGETVGFCPPLIVGEAEIDVLDVLVLDLLQDLVGGAHGGGPVAGELKSAAPRGGR